MAETVRIGLSGPYGMAFKSRCKQELYHMELHLKLHQQLVRQLHQKLQMIRFTQMTLR